MRAPVWLTRCREPLGTGARLMLGVVMLWAGASDLAGSVRAVHAYQLLPYEASTVVGSALPWVEIAVGALLVMGLATRLAAVAGGALLAAFTAGIATAWARGLSIDCGCFGGGGQLAAVSLHRDRERVGDFRVSGATRVVRHKRVR